MRPYQCFTRTISHEPGIFASEKPGPHFVLQDSNMQLAGFMPKNVPLWGLFFFPKMTHL